VAKAKTTVYDKTKHYQKSNAYWFSIKQRYPQSPHS